MLARFFHRLNNSSISEHHRRGILAAFLCLSVIGFADAVYLTITFLTNSPIACGRFGGCDVVAASGYTTIFGIPVAALGAIYYLAVLVLSVLYLDTKKMLFLSLAVLLTPIGFLASIYFVSLQLFVINAICVYCMVSAGTSTALFFVASTLFWFISQHDV